MIDDELAIVWLDNFDFATYAKKRDFLALFDSPSEMLNISNMLAKKAKIQKMFADADCDVLFASLGKIFAQKVVEDLNKKGISFVTIYSATYPKTLKNLADAPFVLYYKGNFDLLSSDCIAVVGSRHITNYGKMATEKFVCSLCEAGLTIVSGLAMGVDTVAHTTTLDNHGKTIAVLANGLDTIYPASNTELAKRILSEGGLLISEFRPQKSVESFMFPIRNRIIAGLSKGVLITEAQEKSGAMHTKNYALEYGRDVFLVPGSIFSAMSAGTNKLIVAGHGMPVLSGEDILNYYGISAKLQEKKFENFSFEESKIVEALSSGEKTFQELVEKTSLDAKALNRSLTMLSIGGIIKKLAGNTYFLVNK